MEVQTARVKQRDLPISGKSFYLNFLAGVPRMAPWHLPAESVPKYLSC